VCCTYIVDGIDVDGHGIRPYAISQEASVVVVGRRVPARLSVTCVARMCVGPQSTVSEYFKKSSIRIKVYKAMAMAKAIISLSLADSWMYLGFLLSLHLIYNRRKLGFASVAIN